jgi:hypothetical protein
MLRARSSWILPLVATLALATGSCRKEAPKESAQEPEPAAEEEAPAPAPAAKAPAAEAPKPAAAPKEAEAAAPAGTNAPAPAPAATPAPAPAPSGPRQALLDPRLLLTLKDVQDLAKGKVTFKRSALQGVPGDEDSDAILYEPEKGSAYGAALQVFRSRTPDAARERFASMLASYQNAQEINPVAGKTFFAYWDEILYVRFLVPARNILVVVSCGRKFCDSDGLYELAKKVGARTNG